MAAAKMIDDPTTRLRLDDDGGGVRIPHLLALGLVLVGLATRLPALLRRAHSGRRPGP